MRTGKVKVLVIEDNPGDTYLIRAGLALGEIPKDLAFVGDGEAALEYLACRGRYGDAARPDLIILDLNLPKIDGRAVLETIKHSPQLRHIPVVVLSTSTSDRDIESSYDNHANCYLSKPADLDKYLDVVSAIESFWLQCVALPPLSSIR